jgi:hypothetical protein
MMQSIRIAACLAVGAMAFAGCSSVQPPRAEIATAELAVQNAQKTSAPQSSPLELRKAREKLDRAKDAMRDRDYVLARQLAEEALVDAQLAESTARSEDATRMARELRDGIEALRREVARSGA